MSFLQINHLYKSFGSAKILDNIDLAAKEGEFLVLVGPSGCGKSTLLNIIAGLIPHDSGDIVIGGKNVVGLHPSKRNIAMVFQSYALYPNMTVEQNICFGMEMNRVPKDKRRKKAMDVAKILQLENLLRRKPSQLSGGQRQRVAMGRAMARSPQVFLFDEPLSNLDAKLRLEMRAEIKKLHFVTGTTMVYVTHDQIEAMTLASRIAVMNQGVIQQFGTPREIYHSPNNTFVAGFMGSPAMNLFEVSLKSKGSNLAAIGRDAKNKDVTFVVSKPSAALKKYAKSKVIMGIRPEGISNSGSGPVAKMQKVNCQVDLVDPIGSDTLVTFILSGVNVTAKLPGDIAVEIKKKITLFFNMERVCFFDKKTGERIN